MNTLFNQVESVGRVWIHLISYCLQNGKIYTYLIENSEMTLNMFLIKSLWRELSEILWIDLRFYLINLSSEKLNLIKKSLLLEINMKKSKKNLLNIQKWCNKTAGLASSLQRNVAPRMMQQNAQLMMM